MLDLDAIRQRAALRASVDSLANPANRLTPEPLPVSQLATVATALVAIKPMRGLAHALAEAINRTCDARGDDAANRAGLLAECSQLSPEEQADMLAHFTVEAARRQQGNAHGTD